MSVGSSPKAHRLVVALLVLMPLAASAASWPTVPLPENSQGERVSSHMIYNGLDMRASRFTSLQPVEAVQAFYARLWGDQHVVDTQDGKTVVGRAQGNHYITVELEAHGDATEATIGIIEMPRSPTPPVLGEGFYRPAGTQVINDIQYLDTPGKTRTLVLENGLSPYLNQQHYVQRMRADGWRSVEPGNCRPASAECIARFERPGGGKIAMTMARGEGGVTALVVNVE